LKTDIRKVSRVRIPFSPVILSCDLNPFSPVTIETSRMRWEVKFE